VHKGIAHSIALESTFLGRRKPAIVVNRGVSFPLAAFNRAKYHVRLGAVVTVCEDIKRVVVASGKLRPGQVRVIYAGVDLSVFDPARLDRAEVRREWGVADDEFLVLQVGAREWTGWRHLVEATALARPRVPRIRTAIVACKNDDEKRAVAEFAAGLGVADAVLPVGFRYDMPNVLMAADLVIDLSYEGIALTGTIREAMALEKPVIATAAGGNPELVIDHSSGLLVPVRDPAAAAEAIVAMATRPQEAARLARAGRERVEAEFSSKVRLDRIEALYRELAAPQRGLGGYLPQVGCGHSPPAAAGRPRMKPSPCAIARKRGAGISQVDCAPRGGGEVSSAGARMTPAKASSCAICPRKRGGLGDASPRSIVGTFRRRRSEVSPARGLREAREGLAPA
jgi:glycosyltransferase involved in cell wall biosynthesis